jgi:hypothetical protein
VSLARRRAEAGGGRTAGCRRRSGMVSRWESIGKGGRWARNQRPLEEHRTATDRRLELVNEPPSTF